jgi:hypothetical protein
MSMVASFEAASALGTGAYFPFRSVERMNLR